MEIRRIWTLRGPNIWSNSPVIEVEIDLGELRDLSSEMMPGFNDRLKAWLPGLIEHKCSPGVRGGFHERLERGTYMAHTLEHVALELQTLAGAKVTFGRARELDTDGVYWVAIEYEVEELAIAAVDTARRLILAAIDGTPFDVAAEVHTLREICHDVKLGPSTGAIVRAARDRNIPTTRLDRDSLVQLGYGVKARRIEAAETDRTSAVAESIAKDKQLTRRLLRSIGVPAPEGRPVRDAADAWKAALEIGIPVVVKPKSGNHGRGVATNLRTREQVEAAYYVAMKEDRNDNVLVERFAPGKDHRLLVVGYQLIAVAVREPAHVIGDGVSTITQLIAEVNKDPRRSDGHATSLSYIRIDPTALGVLADQNMTPDSIPAAGEKVLIRRNGNLSTGGTATDVTDDVHPEVTARAIEAARVVGLDIAGVDLVVEDVRRPIEEQGGAIVEVNAGPGLRMHIEPSAGKPRPVGESIVGLVIPPGDNGRIPIVAVAGSTGRGPITRLISALIGSTGRTVGTTSRDGIYVGRRQIETGDGTGAESVRAVLLNPAVEAAVCECPGETIRREGLGFDRHDVGIVSDMLEPAVYDAPGILKIDHLIRAKRCVIESLLPTGYGVLNADDPHIAEMAEKCRYGKIMYFTLDPANAVVAKHRAVGGRAVIARNDLVILAESEVELELLPISRLPIGEERLGLRVRDAVAAIAALWGLGGSAEQIRDAVMAVFSGNCQLATRGDSQAIVSSVPRDALVQLVDILDKTPSRPRTLIIGGRCCDGEDVRSVGKKLGDRFDRVIIYKRDEYTDELRRGLAMGTRTRDIQDAAGEAAALEFAAHKHGGELLVIDTESVPPSREQFERQNVPQSAPVANPEVKSA